MPRIQINSDHHLELLELYRVWANELSPSEQVRAKTFAERAWEPVAGHVEITFEVDDSFVAFLSARRFRYRKI